MRDIQWAFVSTIIGSFGYVLLRIILGRDLGTDGLGLFTLAYTFYLFGVQFSGFGIQAALTKYVAEFIEDSVTIRHYVSSGLQSSFIMGTILGVGLFVLAPFIAVLFFNLPDLKILIQITAFCYPFLAIQKVVEGTLNGSRRINLYAILNILRTVSILIVSTILVLLCGMGVIGAVIGFVAPTIIIGILSPLLIWKDIGLDFLFLNISIFRSTTLFGFYVVLSDSILFINTNISNIVIAYYLNPSELGIYSVALLFAQIMLLIPSAVRVVTSPVMANRYGKADIKGVKKIFLSSLKKTFIISLATALIIIILGPFLINTLFGEEFQASYLPLIILLLGYIFSATYTSVGSTLWSIGKLTISFRIFLVTGLLNLLLNLLLIPYIGIIGAALSTTVTLLVTVGIQIYLCCKYLQP